MDMVAARTISTDIACAATVELLIPRATSAPRSKNNACRKIRCRMSLDTGGDNQMNQGSWRFRDATA
jgi:hypothetical protein